MDRECFDTRMILYWEIMEECHWMDDGKIHYRKETFTSKNGVSKEMMK